MTQYAQFDPSAPQPAQVIGWIDTEFATYPNLPPSNALLPVTSAQWDARMANPSGWAIQDGSLVAYTPAVSTPTLAQQATAALDAGIAITSTDTPALNATYAVDDRTASNITGILAANANGISVAAQIAEWPDISGVPHDFTWAEFAALVGAILAYRSALQPLIAGAPGSLPAASAAIA